MAKIEFQPHKGIEAIGRGQTREVEFDQDIILVDGREVGIVGRQKGAKVCITQPQGLPESIIKEITLRVDNLRNESGERGVAFPPAVDGESDSQEENTSDE